ncbi:hypothetical protein [Sphingomonas sp. LaA6.9]|uniref:hypothetical protein n=1 Tax=Sphingomonas sp. LaA6.9 TaxID=2919914 RepID=UPI001F4F3501|nr:hypothetical protein [Sphingomonas sp. LaA6.9]MCJ8157408.1 hypothetical protein [Sphingomonas sp. LaA6.9]
MTIASPNPMKDLFDAAARHKTLRFTCRCGHSAIFDGHALWWRFEKKGWNDALRLVPFHMRCGKCRALGRPKIPPRLELTDLDNDTDLPMPSEEDWKRALRRRR